MQSYIIHCQPYDFHYILNKINDFCYASRLLYSADGNVDMNTIDVKLEGASEYIKQFEIEFIKVKEQVA